MDISLEDSVSITNIILFSFIVLFSLTDVTYKIDAYSLIRKKHYEKVIRNEGRLLKILVEIHEALNKNIDLIIQKKYMILQTGIWNLCRKSYCLENGQLELMDTKYLTLGWDSIINDFIELDGKLRELEPVVNKLNSFGVSYSNLFHTYDKDFRLRYFIGEASQKVFSKIEKHRCFSKSDMQQWYTNWVLKDKERDLTDKQVIGHLRDASLTLDYMLLDLLELEYQHCIRRLEKKFTKLNKYSRIKLK